MKKQIFLNALTAFLVFGTSILIPSLSKAQDAETDGPPAQFDTNAEPKVAQAAQINLSPALAEVVRLAQSGADENVVVAYVQKAPAYTVSADEIIYLQDLGISDIILKALVEHGKSGAVGTAPPLANRPPTVSAPPPVPGAPPVTTPSPAPLPEPTPVAPPPAPVPVAAAPLASPPPTVAEFYEPLTPYGNWVIVEPYGWCWQPTVVAVNPGWSPYCDNGNWLWSDSGWYWHSYYSWGWAPFHYGRWFYHPHRRWVWLPDRVWGPSWVCWRESSSYYGWAPLPPGARFSVGIGWTFGGHHVGPNFAFGLSVGAFTFVGANHFADRHIRERRLPPRQVNVVINNTKVVNNYVVGSNNRIINQGVDRGRVESLTGTRVREVAVKEIPTRDRVRAANVMPDRVTRVGGSEVVYRPGPKIELPKKPSVPVVGKNEVLTRQEAPIHRNPVGQGSQMNPAVESRKPAVIEPRTPQPRGETPKATPGVSVPSKIPESRSAYPLQPAKPAIPPATTPSQTVPSPTVPQPVSPPRVNPAPARPVPTRPPPVQHPPRTKPTQEERHDRAALQ